jgi:hypothetical protein
MARDRLLMAAVVLAAGFIGGFVCCFDGDLKEDHCATLGDARRMVPIPDLFVPPQFPDTSSSVSFRRNIDTHETWLRFELNPTQLEQIVAELEQIAPREIRGYDLGRVRDIGWWSDDLRLEQLRNAGDDFRFGIYRVPRRVVLRGGGVLTARAFLAIDLEKHEAYYWQGTVVGP